MGREAVEGRGRWMNVAGGLRKEADKNDPYNIFRRMLERGRPSTSFEDLLRESKGLVLSPD
jgi:hypothetical protein